MKKTLLFGGSGFFGPVILSKNPDIISVGRTKPPIECKNKHIQIDDLTQLNKLDNINFDKVIFLIGSSNHHEINLKDNMGIDLNVYPLNLISICLIFPHYNHWLDLLLNQRMILQCFYFLHLYLEKQN